ncbi:MAG: hypothetical protein PVH26_05945, partial [Desulfosarcina sp.]
MRKVVGRNPAMHYPFNRMVVAMGAIMALLPPSMVSDCLRIRQWLAEATAAYKGIRVSKRAAMSLAMV